MRTVYDAIVGGDLAAAKSAASKDSPALLGGSEEQKAEIDQWIQLIETSVAPADLFAKLGKALLHRTYLAGTDLSIADMAVYNVVKPHTASCTDVHVKRWISMCDDTLPANTGAAAPVKKDGKATTEGEKKANEKPKGDKPKGEKSAKHAGGGGDSGSMPALEGAVEGEVVTRFPPEPSGYLHVGHVKAVLLNNFYARHYKGKLIVRFDDTNPSKEKDEFHENILQDLAALGIKGDMITNTSDYFDYLADQARELIKRGLAFMDNTPQETMRQERMECKDSVHRNATVEENLARFELMYSGVEEGLQWCLRAKINMQDPNGCLRDPVLFRSNLTPHLRTGTKYKAYPTYDFACPLVDSLEGVTHALRTNEYHDRDAQYAWIQNALDVRKVRIHEFSRLNFVFTLLSKRKLAWFVDNNIVDGWYDPRFPTIQGVIRRGCVLPALSEFILSQGASKRVLDMEWDKFWATNKKHIDPIAHRYTSIVSKNIVKVTLTGEGVVNKAEARSVPLHPKDPNMGSKDVFFYKTIYLEQEDAKLFTQGEEITLMKWGNAILDEIVKDGDVITEIKATLNLAGDVKKTKYKVTWISDINDAASGANASTIPLVLKDFDFLINVPKLDEDMDFDKAINHHTVDIEEAIGEPAMKALQPNQIIQLERKGFFRVDSVPTKEGEPMVLFQIPDSKVKPNGVQAKYLVAQAEEAAAAAAAKAKARQEAAEAKAKKKAERAAKLAAEQQA